MGNDVVDLRDQETRLHCLHDRFVERVFTPAERKAISDARETRVALWMRWAAKESAYKVARKLDPTVTFSPRAFEVDAREVMTGLRLMGSVSHGGHRIDVDVVRVRCRQTIHAVALLGSRSRGQRMVADVSQITADDDPSVAVRRLLVASVASALGCAPEELRVVGSRPPRLECRGRAADIDISLSHHGRLAAFAFALSEVRTCERRGPHGRTPHR